MSEANDVDALVKCDSPYMVTIKFGSVEPKTFYREEGGRLVCYAYAIHRDRNGNETHRTEPEPISSIGYEDGTPFTLAECDRILSGKPREKRGLFNWEEYMKINYRKLLKKYIEHVGQCEGTTFTTDNYRHKYFSDSEWIALREVENEYPEDPSMCDSAEE